MTYMNQAQVFAARGSVTVSITIYGVIDQDRIEQARLLAAHRAEQLSYVRPLIRDRPRAFGEFRLTNDPWG